MRKRALSNVFAGIGMSLIILFTSCVNDKNLDLPPIADQSFSEEFDTAVSAISRGWKIQNVSEPHNAGIWQQGGDVIPWFSPWSSNGSYAGFVGVPCAAGAGIVSNWLISPAYTIQNGDKLTFYARGWQWDDGAGDSTDYGNRLQVRINKTNDGTNVGSGSNFGDFTSLMLDINPTYLVSSQVAPEPKSFPTTWTKFEVTVYGIEQPVKGRIGFRYFIEDAASNGTGIAIDKVVYKSVGH